MKKLILLALFAALAMPQAAQRSSRAIVIGLAGFGMIARRK